MARPNIPDDISALSPDEYKTARAALAAYLTEQKDADKSPEQAAELGWCVEQAGVFKAEGEARKLAAATAAQLSNDADAALSDLGPEDEEKTEPEGDPEPEGEPEGEPDAEAVVASAPAVRPVDALIKQASGKGPKGTTVASAPATARQVPVALVAAAGARDVAANATIDRTQFGQLMANAGDQLDRAGKARSGSKLPVASIVASLASDVLVATGQGREDRNMDLINRHRNAHIARRLGDAKPFESLVADGCLCGPAEVLRGINVIVDSSRPVGDELPTIPAESGFVTGIRQPSLAAVDGSVGTFTGDDCDAEEEKSCYFVPCPEPFTAQIQGVYACVTSTRFMQFSQPAWLDANLRVIDAVWAREADTQLLTSIAQGSTFVQGPFTAYGGTAEFVRNLELAVSVMRSQERLGEDVPLDMIVPFWIINLLAADMVARQDGLDHVASIKEWITRILAQMNVTAIYTLDSAGSPFQNMLLGTQGIGALNEFPCEVDVFLYPSGAWGKLQQPRIDYGFMSRDFNRIVDGDLVKLNRVMAFAEVFEAAVFLGPVSWRLQIPVHTTGVVAPRAEEAEDVCDVS